MKHAMKMMLPVMVKGKGKIDAVFNDPVSVESRLDEEDMQTPLDKIKGD
jgi:hypothetical protein